MPFAPKKLNVTSRGCPARPRWVGYEVRDDGDGYRAYVVFDCGNLDELRNCASLAGYAGIVLGGPAVAWA